MARSLPWSLCCTVVKIFFLTLNWCVCRHFSHRIDGRVFAPFVINCQLFYISVDLLGILQIKYCFPQSWCKQHLFVSVDAFQRYISPWLIFLVCFVWAASFPFLLQPPNRGTLLLGNSSVPSFINKQECIFVCALWPLQMTGHCSCTPGRTRLWFRCQWRWSWCLCRAGRLFCTNPLGLPSSWLCCMIWRRTEHMKQPWAKNVFCPS